MNTALFSDKYDVRALSEADIDDIYRLCEGNALYYRYCPPFVTRDSVKADMSALPSGKTAADKYYVGFFGFGRLLAVMDLIDGYPEKDIAYIGFFMTDASLQNRGLGSELIESLCRSLKGCGFSSVRLAWVKGNPQAEHFWLKNRFVPIRETKSSAADKVILAERPL